MMFKKLNRVALALVLVLLAAPSMNAAQEGEQAGAEEADQQVAAQADALTEELRTDTTTESGATAPEQAAALVGAEPMEEEPAPLPDPEEVVKTKTKSNQSND